MEMDHGAAPSPTTAMTTTAPGRRAAVARFARSSRSSSVLYPSPSSSTSPPDGTITRFFVVAVHRPGDDDAYRNGGFGAVAAAGEAIAALPKSTAGGEESQRAGECAVCLEGYAKGQVLRRMPCEHEFHESCIFEWLRVSRVCPLCRFKLPAETQESDDDAAEQHDVDYHSTTC
ncbi:hypothetical protein PR202_gb00575 [Eleusine coracana subsp. coracana]|uniref:RING-type domain-containing protein n=1 Tax=Eleusine coracana subsp. coracana TaxID=191504 RepID=A0AAV5DS81_ELECO|nr:hypothetical protein QOZ80_5BG0427950 [Eleusine coracana subsp. coracana]GJN13828.1 hypothetical protein PR202_gb00575 [Eleusine coracana subsp. coracana]